MSAAPMSLRVMLTLRPPTAPSPGDSDSSKVRNKLRKFLQRRPTLQSLRERGYIKGRDVPWVSPDVTSHPCPPPLFSPRSGFWVLAASVV